ncbi:serine hydrolase-like protein 2 [Nymphalis io]|uniref:serine hydrolase-like protein 2 n=1 Tax=Inachis io TaxID=171585 RepID=UPI002167B509|nr:serine hydrolase-like protein 2 [Nymphalis io]
MTVLEKEWFIQAPWGRLCIVAWGDCYDPPVLVCPGSKDTVISFRPLIEMLPKNFYYIGLDLPGSGRSDHMPHGLMISMYDLLYSIQVVVKHFRWESFIYLGHSMGCTLGKLYDLSYPGKISKAIDLDPVTLGVVFPVELFPIWYETSLIKYFNDYKKFNSTTEEKPTYNEEMIVSKMMKRRGISKELARDIISRLSEPAGNGLIRYTFDERVNFPVHSPFPPEHLLKLLKSLKTPTLTIITEDSVNARHFTKTPFLLDESLLSDNYRVKLVTGCHDVHIAEPGKVASFVGQFLLHGLNGLDNKAKL